MPENFEKPSMPRLYIARITEEQQMVPGAFSDPWFFSSLGFNFFLFPLETLL